jgi:ABC-type transport system substrate-binding protein
VLNKKLASLLAASAVVALLAGAVPSAYAQMVPMPPPSRVDVYTNGPQVDPGDNPANWSARQNVVDSQRYERLVHTNPAFRQARIRKECGSINEPDLYQQCVASFDR